MRHYNKMRVFLICSSMLALLSAAVSARADVTVSSVPNAIHYQSRLMNPQGVSYDGQVSVNVLLYDSPTLGVNGDLDNEHLLYAETHQLNVERGDLRFSIGEGSPSGRFAGTALPLEKIAIAGDVYLELIINDEPILPRQRFAYGDRAIYAQYAKKAAGLTKPFTITAGSVPEMPASKVSGLLPVARIDTKNLNTSYLDGQVSKATIPAGLPLSNINSGYLDNGVIPNIPAQNIKGKFSSGKMPTSVMMSEDVNMLMTTGEVAHGQILPVPSGFEVSNCHSIVSLNQLATPVIGIDKLSVYTEWVGSGPRYVHCQIDPENHECRRVLNDPPTPPPGYPYHEECLGIIPCSVNYLTICQK